MEEVTTKKRHNHSRENQDIQDRVDDLIATMIKSRKRKKITQSDLAIMTSIPQATISRIESFKAIPSLPVMINIADKLDLELSFTDLAHYQVRELEKGE